MEHGVTGNCLFSRRPYIFLVLVGLFLFPLGAEAMVVNANVIQRTFRIAWKNPTGPGSKTGTGFTIDHDSKQYLITARHVVPGIRSGNTIKRLHDKKWEDLVVNVVGIGKGDIDVAVLACSIPLSPSYPLVASTKSLKLGQPVSFLGYPFGLDGGGEYINRGFPLPFVKAGVVSALESGKDQPLIFLDAHGNKGFSGGPVVFAPNGRPKDGLRVAGIISRLPPTPPSSWQPIVDRRGELIPDREGNPIGYVRENPGIVVVIGIRHALELIDANPIGFQLPADKDGQ